MENIKQTNDDIWVRPWMLEKFDDLYNRDERFFSVLIKGVLGWLTNNIVLYNKPIKHFIFNTGSSYLYVESNGYNFSWSETTGEDAMYMQMPRCVVSMGDVNIPTEELTQPYVLGVFERKSGNKICGYNGEIRRLPVEVSLSLKYALSNFNESIVLLQEILDKLIFQKYFSITYLGQIIQCSIEYPLSEHIEVNKLDMAGTETNQKTIELEIKICTNYPIINERTQIPNQYVAETMQYNINLYDDDEIKDTEEIRVE